MTDFPRKIKNLPVYEGDVSTFCLQAERCRVLFATLEPGTKTDTHTHPGDNYTVVTEGELIVEMDGQIQKFPTGSWCIIPAETPHSAAVEKLTRVIDFSFEHGDENRDVEANEKSCR